jgi:hypothetical protein
VELHEIDLLSIKIKPKRGLKTTRAYFKALFRNKIRRKSHKTCIKSRTSERIWFSQKFCAARFTWSGPDGDRGGTEVNLGGQDFPGI